MRIKNVQKYADAICESPLNWYQFKDWSFLNFCTKLSQNFPNSTGSTGSPERKASQIVPISVMKYSGISNISATSFEFSKNFLAELPK